MKNTQARSNASLRSDLDHLRAVYPAGTHCWFYEAAEQASAKRGTIKSWAILDGHTLVAHMATGEIIPLIHILLDQSTVS